MNTYVAVETVRSLSDSINTTRHLTGADSLISIQLAARLLQYESSLSGLSLSHVQHDTYISVSYLMCTVNRVSIEPD